MNHKEDSDKFAPVRLSDYPQDEIASFIVSKCEKDTTKLVGKLRYYNNYGNPYKPDTIIYKCQ